MNTKYRGFGEFKVSNIVVRMSALYRQRTNYHDSNCQNITQRQEKQKYQEY